MVSTHGRRAAFGLTLAAAPFAAHAAPALCAHSAALRRRLGVRDSIADRGGVALTFDDGPHPRGTPATLEILRAAGVTATFFLAGEQVQAFPEVAEAVAADGHAIALHCHRHRNLLRVTPAQLRDDLRRAEAAIADVTGRVPVLYRPPYGVLTAAALAAARRRGWETVLWARWGRDWRARATAESVAREVAGGLHGGEVLLLHDADHYSAPGSWRTTVDALPRVLDLVRERGLRFVALEQPAAACVLRRGAG